MPTIVDCDRMRMNCAAMLKLAGILGLPTIATEQNPQGLGGTVFEVAEAMPESAVLIEKTRFSAAVPEVMDRLEQWQRPNVLIAGIEAHVCVLQSVLDLQAAGWQCWPVSEAISACQADQIPHAFDRMTRAGAVVTGVISAMYELLGESTHPAFKECLGLAKACIGGGSRVIYKNKT